MKNSISEEEAKNKFCPIIEKSCKGSHCMMFVFVEEETRNVVNPKKPLNEPEEKEVPLYACGLVAIAPDKVNLSLNFKEDFKEDEDGNTE